MLVRRFQDRLARQAVRRSDFAGGVGQQEGLDHVRADAEIQILRPRPAEERLDVAEDPRRPGQRQEQQEGHDQLMRFPRSSS